MLHHSHVPLLARQGMAAVGPLFIVKLGGCKQLL